MKASLKDNKRWIVAFAKATAPVTSRDHFGASRTRICTSNTVRTFYISFSLSACLLGTSGNCTPKQNSYDSFSNKLMSALYRRLCFISHLFWKLYANPKPNETKINKTEYKINETK